MPFILSKLAALFTLVLVASSRSPLSDPSKNLASQLMEIHSDRQHIVP